MLFSIPSLASLKFEIFEGKMTFYPKIRTENKFPSYKTRTKIALENAFIHQILEHIIYDRHETHPFEWYSVDFFRTHNYLCNDVIVTSKFEK